MKYTIYLVTNKENGKRYVGYTGMPSVMDRWKKHWHVALYSTRKHPLSNAIRKYGRDTFLVEEVIKTSSKQKALQAEISYIKQYNALVPNGYNVILTAQPGGYGEKFRQSCIDCEKAKQRRKPIAQIDPATGKLVKKWESRHHAARGLGLSLCRIVTASTHGDVVGGFRFAAWPEYEKNRNPELYIVPNWTLKGRRPKLIIGTSPTGVQTVFMGATGAARTLKFRRRSIIHCLSKEWKTYNGYTFEYVKE